MEFAAVAAALGVGSALTAAVQWVLGRSKTAADVALTKVESEVRLIDSATTVVAMVREQMEGFRREAEELREEVENLRTAVEALVEEVHRLGGDPHAAMARRYKEL